MTKKDFTNTKIGIVSNVYKNKFTLIDYPSKDDFSYKFISTTLFGVGLSINFTLNILLIIIGYNLANVLGGILMILPICWLMFSIYMYGNYAKKFNPRDFQLKDNLEVFEELDFDIGDTIKLTEKLTIEYN